VVGKVVAAHDIVNLSGSMTLTSGKASISPIKDATVHGGLIGGLLILTEAMATNSKRRSTLKLIAMLILIMAFRGLHDREVSYCRSEPSLHERIPLSHLAR
jgi:hypothetical protein